MKNDSLVKDEILKLYPNVNIKNNYFFNQRVLNDFSLEDIAFKLCSLEEKDAWFLSMYLYSYASSNAMHDMINFIVKNDIEYFTNCNDEKFKEADLFRKYVKLYSTNDFFVEDFDKIREFNRKKNSNVDFYHIDISYFNEIIIVQKMYKEGKIKLQDIKEFIQFNFEKLQKKIIKDVGNYSSDYDRYINDIITYLIIGKISVEDFYKCVNEYNSVKNLLSVGKFGVVLNSEKLPIEIICLVKEKHIKILYDSLCDRNLDNIMNNYNKEKIIEILIKMYSYLGINNVDKIIKHLPEDERKINNLFYAFRSIDLSTVSLINGKIQYNDDFIKFFMGDNLFETTSLLNLIYENKTNLDSKLEEIYNYWGELDLRYRSQKLETRLSLIEKAFEFNNVVLNPDEYKLEGNIINNCYDNQQYQRLNKFSMVDRIRQIYDKMKHSYKKSIPYVRGNYEDYTFELLKANDPNLFVMGSETDCCFKLGGDADSFVEYCAINNNGRVLCVKNQNDKIVACVPMVRNGNLILCNSIESKNRKNVVFMEKMFKIMEIVGNNFIDISKASESEEKRIKGVLVGNYKNEIEKFNKYPSISCGVIPDECLRPYDDKNLHIYANMGGFDWENYVIACEKNINWSNLKSFDVGALYSDDRSQVLELEDYQINDKDILAVQSIYYEINNKLLDFDNVVKVIYNEDWFIFIDKNYHIISGIVGNDSRANAEYLEYLLLEKEYCSYYDEDSYVLDNAKYR